MDDYLGYLIFGPLFLLGVGLLLYAQIGDFKGFFIQCGWICLQIAGIAVGAGVVIEGARLIGVTPYSSDLEWKPVKWASVIVGVLAALIATLIVNWLLERRRAKREQLPSPERAGNSLPSIANRCGVTWTIFVDGLVSCSDQRQPLT